MFNTKLLSSILLVLAVLFAQIGNVAAAPPLQEGTTTTISGKITNIETKTDENDQTIVLVTVEGMTGTQTASLSPQEAADLGLFDLNTGQLLAKEGDSVELVVNPNSIVPAEDTTAPDVHIISKLLADFFFKGDPEMAKLIDSYHTGDNDANQVFGFGVIAQALWMSKSFSESGTANADLAGLILQAKKDGDYSQLSQYFKDGAAPSNWGQLKKALRDHKEKQNLGVIISGHANSDQEDGINTQDNGTNKDNGNNKDHGKGKGKDKQKNPNHP